MAKEGFFRKSHGSDVCEDRGQGTEGLRPPMAALQGVRSAVVVEGIRHDNLGVEFGVGRAAVNRKFDNINSF